jgi:hypothetical protein
MGGFVDFAVDISAWKGRSTLFYRKRTSELQLVSISTETSELTKRKKLRGP